MTALETGADGPERTTDAAAAAPESEVPPRPGLLVRAGRTWIAFRDWMGRRWRTSLQFRTVAVTLVLGAVVTVLLQSFSYTRTSAALMEGKVRTAQEDATYRASNIQRNLDSTDRSDAQSLRELTFDLMQQQASRAPDQLREVILTHGAGNTSPGTIPGMSTAFESDVLPSDLRAAVNDDPAHQQVQIAPVPDRGASEVPAVMVGQLVTIPDSGSYELYFVYPMEREAETMDTMLRTYILGGVLLTGLIGLVALAVTRLVVDPVREAATVAERLADGHLNERMQLRGEDDLARLTRAFNSMADSLQNQIRRLEELSQVQQRFVSDVSHELRTPLTTIQMATSMIITEKDSFSPVVKRSAELLDGEVERFEDMLAGLLEISRHDAGSVDLDTERMDIRPVVARVLDAAEVLRQAKGSPIEVIETTEGPFDVEIDSRRIERILRNLVVNALEHGLGNPIRIEIGANEQAVAVSVRDHGIGLEPGQSALVFNRFWRADPSRNRTTGGTGLGLSIALEDARLHRGLLQAWGVPGEGTRFRLTLPREAGMSITEIPLALSDGPIEPSVLDTGPLPIVGEPGPGATAVPVASDSDRGPAS